MQVKEYVEVPAKVPASCAFAGDDMQNLIVVTATHGVDIKEDENAGYTFICKTKTKGRKPYLFG